MLADFHKVGIKPDFNDELNKSVKSAKSSFAHALRIRTGRLSTQGDLLLSITDIFT